MAAFALGPDAAAAGYRLLALDAVGSTSAAAREAGRAGEASPLWVTARRQTAGHGRRGRAWQSPDGNLAASLLLATGAPPAEAAMLGFVAGLALHRAIAVTVPTLAGRLALKWPNDVLLDGAKLAGILVEAEAMAPGAALLTSPLAGEVESPASAGDPGEGYALSANAAPWAGVPVTLAPSHKGRGDRAAARRYAVVVGIGVNIAAAPACLPYPAASLADLGAAISAEALFAALTDAWVPLLRQWEEGGFATLRAAWLACAAGLGGPIAAERGGEAVAGTFETIDESGRLIIRGADGARRMVAAGDVHFGAARTAQFEEAG